MNHTEPKCAEIIYLLFLADTNKIRRIGICTPLEILGLLSQCASNLAFYLFIYNAIILGKLIYATTLSYIEKKIFYFQV